MFTRWSRCGYVWSRDHCWKIGKAPYIFADVPIGTSLFRMESPWKNYRFWHVHKYRFPVSSLDFLLLDCLKSTFFNIIFRNSNEITSLLQGLQTVLNFFFLHLIFRFWISFEFFCEKILPQNFNECVSSLVHAPNEKDTASVSDFASLRDQIFLEYLKMLSFSGNQFDAFNADEKFQINLWKYFVRSGKLFE